MIPPEAGEPAAKESERSICDLLTDCVRAMVQQPDAVSVEEHQDQDTITFVITVADSDLGRVVGKQGAAIQGLRAIVKAANRTKFRMSLRLAAGEQEE